MIRPSDTSVGMASRGLNEDVREQGYHTKPFPEPLRQRVLKHVDGRVRSFAASQGVDGGDETPLEKLALAIEDEVWTTRMHRANRMFPDELAHQLHDWAASVLLPELGKKQSAVNVVEPKELKINPGLRTDSWAVYWRCVRPGKPDAGRAHRDSTFWEIEASEGYDTCVPFKYDYKTDCLKIWVPIANCRPETTLQIIPGSHREQIPIEVAMTEYGRRPTISAGWLADNAHRYMSPIELSQGSCILFDLDLVHRGPTHNEDRLRISAEFNFIFGD